MICNFKKLLVLLGAILLFAAISSATTSASTHSHGQKDVSDHATPHKAKKAGHTRSSVQKSSSSTKSAATGAQARRTSRSKTRASAHKKGASQRAASRPHGQQGIQSDRAREIQEALIREKYLDGDPTGVWDARTKQAMVRYQNDNGWQTRSVPDSRALIRLGLGPNHANLINPDSVRASIPDSAGELQPGGSDAAQ